MNNEASASPTWQWTVVERQMPDQHGIRSLVLAPLADAEGEFIYLLIRFRTTFPEPSGVEGDHLYVSSAEAREAAALQFGVQDSDWRACLLVKAA